MNPEHYINPRWVRVFTCGTRVVLRSPTGTYFRVVCATCETKGTRFDCREDATAHAVKTSALPCRSCGAR